LTLVPDLDQPEVQQRLSTLDRPETWAVGSGAESASKMTGVPPHPAGAVDAGSFSRIHLGWVYQTRRGQLQIPSKRLPARRV